MDIFTVSSSEDPLLLARLLEGLTLEEKRVLVNERCSIGLTPLHYCASSFVGSAAVARSLILQGANCNAQDVESWSSPLHCALFYGNFGVAVALLEGGAILDKDGSESQFDDMENWIGSPYRPPRTTAMCPLDKNGDSPYESLVSPASLVHAISNSLADILNELRLRGVAKSIKLPVEIRQNDSCVHKCSPHDDMAYMNWAESPSIHPPPPLPDDFPREGNYKVFTDQFSQEVQVKDSACMIVVPPASPRALGGRSWDWYTSIFVWGEDRFQMGVASSGSSNSTAIPRVLFLSGLDDAASADSSVFGGYSPIVVSVSASSNHSMFLTSKGRVFTCGNNSKGLLGLGGEKGKDVQLTPIEIPFFFKLKTPVSFISAGQCHTLAISAGVVYAWGDGSHGALGLGQFFPCDGGEPENGFVCSPRPIEGLLKRRFCTSVSAGSTHSLAVTDDGTLFVWGSNANGQLGCRSIPMRPAATSFGAETSKPPCPWICWSPKSSDSLNFNSSCATTGSLPAFLSSQDVWSVASVFEDESESFAPPPLKQNSVISASAASTFTLLVTVEGDVWSCGRGGCTWKKLIFDTAAADQFDSVETFNERVLGIAKSKQRWTDDHSGVGRERGADKKNKKLPLIKPAPCPSVQPIQETLECLSSRGFNVLFRTRVATDGESVEVGTNLNKWEVSQGSRSAKKNRLAATVESGSWFSTRNNQALRPACIKAVSSGPHHALALDSTGSVWTWGEDENLLGRHRVSLDGKIENGWTSPRRVSYFSKRSLKIVKICAGSKHSACIDDKGNVYTWGGGEYSLSRGLLGRSKRAAGLEDAGILPQRVPSIAQAVDIAAGSSHTIVITGFYLPPLPPLRPSLLDVAHAVHTETKNEQAFSPTVLLKDAACGCSQKPEASRARAREVFRLYSPVVFEEVQSVSVSSRVDRDCSRNEVAVKDFSTAIYYVPPSLRSLCERVLIQNTGVGIAPTLALLSLVSPLNAHGIGAFVGAFIRANASAVLSFLASASGKDSLIGLGDVCVQGSLCGGGFRRWAWNPPHYFASLIAKEKARVCTRMQLYRALEYRELSLIRPLSGEVMGQHISDRWWTHSSKKKNYELTVKVAAEKAGMSSLGKALDAVVVVDCIRARSLLFANSECHPHKSAIPSASIDNAFSSEVKSPEMTTGHLTFQEAFSCIMRSRNNVSNSSLGLSSAPVAEPLPSPTPLPPSLQTTLPASPTSHGIQLSLDRLACNLTELDCGIQQNGLDRLFAPHIGRPIPATIARRMITDSMLGDSLSLLNRAQKLQRKSHEAVSLAISGVCVIVEKSGGLKRWMSRSFDSPIPLSAPLLEKLSSRLDWCIELECLSSHLQAFALLTGRLLGVGVFNGEDLISRLEHLSRELARLQEIQLKFVDMGLTSASFSASGVTQSSPFSDVLTAVATALSSGGKKGDCAIASSSCIVGSELAKVQSLFFKPSTRAVTPPPIPPLSSSLLPSTPHESHATSFQMNSLKNCGKNERGEVQTPTPAAASPWKRVGPNSTRLSFPSLLAGTKSEAPLLPSPISPKQNPFALQQPLQKIASVPGGSPVRINLDTIVANQKYVLEIQKATFAEAAKREENKLNRIRNAFLNGGGGGGAALSLSDLQRQENLRARENEKEKVLYKSGTTNAWGLGLNVHKKK